MWSYTLLRKLQCFQKSAWKENWWLEAVKPIKMYKKIKEPFYFGGPSLWKLNWCCLKHAAVQSKPPAHSSSAFIHKDKQRLSHAAPAPSVNRQLLLPDIESCTWHRNWMHLGYCGLYGWLIDSYHSAGRCYIFKVSVIWFFSFSTVCGFMWKVYLNLVSCEELCGRTAQASAEFW